MNNHISHLGHFSCIHSANICKQLVYIKCDPHPPKKGACDLVIISQQKFWFFVVVNALKFWMTFVAQALHVIVATASGKGVVTFQLLFCFCHCVTVALLFIALTVASGRVSTSLSTHWVSDGGEW